MNGPYPLVPLAEVLTHYTQYIEAPEPKLYPKLSVRLYGKGVLLDTPADGLTLKMKRHQIAKSGQVILSEIWGKKGAIGFVPPEGEGALCTSHFFLFDVRPDRVDPKYLHLIFAANYLQDQLDSEAKGTTGYAAVRPKYLLAAKIPLPPLDEQRCIVSRVQELGTKIEEARRLQGEVAAEMDSLCQSLILNPPDGQTTSTAMRELLTQRNPEIIVEPTRTYHFAGVYCFGGGVFPGRRKSGAEFSYRILSRLRKQDFIYPKLMAWEGALGVVPDACDGLYVSPEFPVFEVLQDRVLPEVLDTYFRTPKVWPELAAISTGTNVRRRRLHPKSFLLYKIPLPSMSVQRQLRSIKQRVEQSKRLQSETAVELNALMPSILSRAFRGEL